MELFKPNKDDYMVYFANHSNSENLLFFAQELFSHDGTILIVVCATMFLLLFCMFKCRNAHDRDQKNMRLTLHCAISYIER